MNKKCVFSALLLLLIFGSFGSSYAATIFSEDFNTAIGTPPLYDIKSGLFSEKWSFTNYYTGGLPSATGWTFGGSAYLAQNGNNSADSAILLNEAGNGGHGSMSTTINNLTHSANYLLTFDYWGDNRPGTAYEFTVTIGSISQTISGNWTTPGGSGATDSIYFTATSPNITLSFLDISTGEASPIIDNVKISSVPIPAAAWLLGSGLVGLLGIRRKVFS